MKKLIKNFFKKNLENKF